MDKYGPLYHRNGAKLWPSFLARLVLGLVILGGLGLLATIVASAIR